MNMFVLQCLPVSMLVKQQSFKYEVTAVHSFFFFTLPLWRGPVLVLVLRVSTSVCWAFYGPATDRCNRCNWTSSWTELPHGIWFSTIADGRVVEPFVGISEHACTANADWPRGFSRGPINGLCFLNKCNELAHLIFYFCFGCFSSFFSFFLFKGSMEKLRTCPENRVWCI